MKRPIYTTDVVDRIKNMQDDGSTNKEIAMAIGTTEGSINSRTSQLGLSRKRVLFGSITAHVPAAVVHKYHAAARARSLPVSRLMRLLMIRIARDDLISAILDDGK